MKATLKFMFSLFVTLTVVLWICYPSNTDAEQWTAIGPEGAAISDLAIDPQIPSIIYAGTTNMGIYKSADGGKNWILSNTGFTSLSIRFLVIDPVFPTTLYAGTNAGLFKSYDSGSSWATINTGIPTTDINVLFIDSSATHIIYAGTVNYGLFKSLDGGETWNAMPGQSDCTIETIAVSPSDPLTMYISVHSSSISYKDMKSNDGGENWSTISAYRASDFIIVDPTSAFTFYSVRTGMVGANGIYKSIDGGDNYNLILGQTIGGMPPKSSLGKLIIEPQNPSTLYAIEVSFFYSGYIYKTIDSGATWTVLTTIDGLSTLAVDSQTPSTIYAGTRWNGVLKYAVEEEVIPEDVIDTNADGGSCFISTFIF